MSGTGSMTPIPGGPVAPSTYVDEWCTGALPLALYAERFVRAECGFWGVSNPTEDTYSCRHIWNKFQRDELAFALCEAQEEIEDEAGYPLQRKWFTDETHNYKSSVFAIQNHIIAGGVQSITVIDDDSPVDHTNDPAVIGPLASTVTDEKEIKVYYPDTTQEITPRQITIAGGQVTIWIPRCRLVDAAYINNPDEGLDYNNLLYFQSTVDVKRVYNDPSTNAVLFTNHNCSAICSQYGCNEYTQDACMKIVKPVTSLVEVFPADYANATWTRETVCRSYGHMRLNYYAGIDPTRQAQDAIVRLAHAKMSKEPCGCNPIQQLWKRDTNVPNALTRERINCPFGLSDGAWAAWQFAQAMKVVRGGRSL